MPLKDPESAAASALTVSQLNRRVKSLLESDLGRIWVEGEISNLSRPASGHIYLSLKDTTAQVSAAWFRQRQRGPAVSFKNGDRVLAYGQVSLYEARGNYQLIIEQLEPAGEGVLKRRFDALKLKLSNEGLFAPERKQELPTLPSGIGIVTSPSGAALRDILSVLRRRFPAIPVTIYPASVQGDAAPGELIAALNKATSRKDCDVLIVSRGGGSLEDLWAFNDEELARAIAESPIPVVSAVGHETDFTIADFVADLRAPTPSAAAEIIVPDRRDWLRRLRALTSRLTRNGERTLDDRSQQLDWLGRRLLSGSPSATLQRQGASLREQTGRLQAAMRQQLMQTRVALQRGSAALLQASPAVPVQRSISQLERLQQRLAVTMHAGLAERQHKTSLLGRALNSVSPLATLDRGYAIVTRAETAEVLIDAGRLKVGDDIRARLAKGEIVATVKTVHTK